MFAALQIQKTYDFTKTLYVCPATEAAKAVPSDRQLYTFSMEVFGLAVGDSAKAKSVCEALLRTLDDATAVCKVASVGTPASAGNRRLLQAPTSSTRSKVVVQVATTDAAGITAAMAAPVIVSTNLQPSSMAVVPNSVSSTTAVPVPEGFGDSPAPAAAPEESSGSSSSVGAIVGGVVGGIVALAAVAVAIVSAAADELLLARGGRGRAGPPLCTTSRRPRPLTALLH